MPNTKTLDPVQGLVDYVLEIKPYHTKIVEVLVEYIQTDPINVTVTEDIDLCINLGYPSIDSRYIFPIIGVDTIANTFTVSGDQTPSLFVGMITEVFGSTLNDNKYTITSILFDGVNTVVSVSSNIPDTTIDGQLVHNAIEYCPDSNLYGTNITPDLIEESCAGGFGDVYDSYTPIYDIDSVDDTLNQITIAGDYSAEFAMDVPIQFEYVTVTTGSPVISTINSLSLTVLSVTVDNTIPTAPLTIITSVQDWYIVGSPATFDNGVIYITNIAYDVVDINEGTSINTFSIAGDYTNTFDNGTLLEIKFSDGNDGIYYVIQTQLSGGNTIIFVSQHVPFPEATRKGQLLFRAIGFDEQVYCSTVPESRIDVVFDERIEFGNLQLDFQDNIMAYNLENTDSVPYGGFPYGTILSATEPAIIESVNAPSPSGSPLSIPLFTFWLDQTLSTGSPITVTSAVMKQWNGLRWVSISTAYWVDSDTDQMYQRIYRIVDGTTIDTGWVEVNSLGIFGGTEIFGASEIEPIAVQNYSAGSTGSPLTGQTTYTLGTPVPSADSELISVTVNGLPAGITLDSATVFTITSPTVDVGDWIVATIKDRTGTPSNVLIAGYSSEPHTVFHGGVFGGGSPLENVVTPNGTNSFEIYGGNFAYHFFGGNKFEGYDDTGLLGEWQTTSFAVVDVNAPGSPTSYSMSVPGDLTTYFTAGVSFYVSTTQTNKGWFTTVSSNFDGTNTIIIVSEEVLESIFTTGGSPGITIDQNYTKDLGTIQGALFDPSTQKTIVIPKTTGDANVDRITYQWIGPLRIDVDMLPTDFLGQTITGNMEISGELIGSANFLNIINVSLANNTFTVLGDQTSYFASDATFTIQDAYTNNGSPEITNNGDWITDQVYYNYSVAGTEEIVAVDFVANTITIAGDYISKFSNGFVFDIDAGGSPSITGTYIVDVPGATLIASPVQTVIPLTTDIIDISGSPAPLTTAIFGETSETIIHVTDTIVTDTTNPSEPIYGRILSAQATTGTQVSGQITDELQFGWTVDDWFQYAILSVDLVDNTITVTGDARGDLQIGQDFEILGAYDTTGSPPNGSPPGITNNGLYKVRIDEEYRNGSPIRSEVDFDGTNTTITVYPDLETTAVPYGFIEPDNNAQAIIAFSDLIGVIAVETADAVVLQTGGAIIDSWDYTFWDVGSFDENLGTVIHLYSGTFE